MAFQQASGPVWFRQARLNVKSVPRMEPDILTNQIQIEAGRI